MHSPTTILRALGDRLHDRRIAADLSQGALAKRSGVSRDTVLRIERGDNIGIEPLLRIAIVLDAADEFATLFPKRDTRTLDEILAGQQTRRRVRTKKSKGQDAREH
jgi:transcriptional regulator with XRE-family HTH domain